MIREQTGGQCGLETISGGKTTGKDLGAGGDGITVHSGKMPPPQGQQQTSTAEIEPPQVTEPIQQLHCPALLQRPLQAEQRLAAALRDANARHEEALAAKTQAHREEARAAVAMAIAKLTAGAGAKVAALAAITAAEGAAAAAKAYRPESHKRRWRAWVHGALTTRARATVGPAPRAVVPSKGLSAAPRRCERQQGYRPRAES